MMDGLIDIHSHRLALEGDGKVVRIANLHNGFERAADGLLCSVGVHPRYVMGDGVRQLEQLSAYAILPNVLAVGECGLDWLCDTDRLLQQAVLKQQLTIANELDKPLVIHCVRAFDELMHLLEHCRPRVPVVVHGFNKKTVVAERLLAKGYYLSFGAAILNGGWPARAILKVIETDRFFLETDDWQGNIGELYKVAAEVRAITVETIILQIADNFKKVFKR